MHTHTSLGITSTVTQIDRSLAIPVLVRAIHTPHTECEVTISLSSPPSPPNVCLVTHCNGTQRWSVSVCERQKEGEKAWVWAWDRHGERQTDWERECECMMCIQYVCLCVRERYCVSQCAVSGLAVWADTDYSLHSSLPSQATIATAKALYFKKLQHCAGSRIAFMPPAVRQLASQSEI